MNDFEETLTRVPLAEPSSAMDAAIKRYFREAAARPPRFWERHVTLWQCAAACLVCGAAGFLASAVIGRPAPAPTQVTERIYYLPSRDAGYRDAFDLPAPGSTPAAIVRKAPGECGAGMQRSTRKDERI